MHATGTLSLRMRPFLSTTVPSNGVCWSGSCPGESGGGGDSGDGLGVPGGLATPQWHDHGKMHVVVVSGLSMYP